MPLRIALDDLQLANALYAGATVDVWALDANLAKTATRLTLYSGPTGVATATNPQTLDSRGKWAAPVYVEAPYILTITPTTGLAHDTAAAGLVSRWRGVWQTSTLYFPNERVRHPTEATTYLVLVGHTSGVFATDLGAAKLEEEWDAEAIGEGTQEAFGDWLHGSTFDLIGDGVTDESTNLQAFFDACAAQKRPGMLAPGTYLTSGATLKSNAYIYGSGRENTVIKLKASSNVHVIKGENADALFGGGTYAGLRNFGLFDLCVDGNRANQAPANPELCCGVAIYGAKGHMARLLIKEVDGHALWTEWGQYGEPVGGMASRYDDIEIDTCGRHGWKNHGPHDSMATAVIVCDASQETNNTWDGINQGAYGASHYHACHTWHRAATTNRVRWGGHSTGNSMWKGCQFEGGRGQFRAAGDNDQITGCRFYAHSGGAATAMVVLAGSNTQIVNGFWQNNGSGTDCYAVKIGDGSTIAGYDIGGLFFNFQTRTPFNFANDGGGIIRGQGSATAAGATAFAGTIHASSRIAYSQIGTVIEFHPDPLFGRYPSTRQSIGAATWGSYANVGTAPGERQRQDYLLTLETTNATPALMTTDGGVSSAYTVPIVPAAGAMTFDGEVIAFELATGDTKRWTITGAIRRVTNVASTALIGSATVSSTHASAGASAWTLGVTADATFFGALLLTATGEAAHNIIWLANVRCTQVQPQ